MDELYNKEFIKWLKEQPSGLLDCLFELYQKGEAPIPGPVSQLPPQYQMETRPPETKPVFQRWMDENPLLSRPLSNNEIYNFAKELGLSDRAAHKALMWKRHG